MTEAYCVKCKKKVEIKDEKESLSKNGVKMLKGTCSECGTKVCRFLGR